MADATEGIVAAIAAAGGNNEVVFAAGDRIAEDDFGGDDVAFNKRRARQIAAPSFQTRHQALSTRHQSPISHLGELLEERVVLLEALLFAVFRIASAFSLSSRRSIVPNRP